MISSRNNAIWHSTFFSWILQISSCYVVFSAWDGIAKIFDLLTTNAFNVTILIQGRMLRAIFLSAYLSETDVYATFTVILFTRAWNSREHRTRMTNELIPLCMRRGTLITIRPYWHELTKESIDRPLLIYPCQRHKVNRFHLLHWPVGGIHLHIHDHWETWVKIEVFREL